MSKREIDLILEKLNEIHGDVKKINEEKIPGLQIQQAALAQKVKSDAKINARIYGAIYGGITLLISLAGLTVAFWKK